MSSLGPSSSASFVLLAANGAADAGEREGERRAAFLPTQNAAARRALLRRRRRHETVFGVGWALSLWVDAGRGRMERARSRRASACLL